MRINFVLPHAGLSGGVRVVAAYAKRLQARGHEVTVISQPWSKPTFRQRLRGWAKRALKGGPAAVRREGGSHLDGLKIRHKVLERRRPVQDADVPDGDVVVATWWETATWVAKLSAAKGAKVHFVQGRDAVSYEQLRPEMVERVTDAWKLPLAKVAVSKWLEGLVRETCQAYPVTCIANGVDLGAFYGEARDKQARPTFGFVYSQALYKGCDIIIEAIETARRAMGEVRVVSFGEIKPASALPAGCEYVLTPDEATMRRLYGGCDGWLFGSRQEGFGLPILEAMACHTPVIATRAGAAPEMLSGGGGMLLEETTSRAMASAMQEMAGMSNGDWRVMSDRAAATASAYSWDEATGRFEAALHEAVRWSKGEG